MRKQYNKAMAMRKLKRDWIDNKIKEIETDTKSLNEKVNEQNRTVKETAKATIRQGTEIS